MGDAAEDIERLRESIERLERTVGRFVVVLERQLSASESEQARALRSVVPEFDAIREQVRKKMAGRR
jgi:hypothetical protein